MNVHVLGSDHSLGLDFSVGGFLKELAPEAKKVAVNYVSQRLTPTQKSAIQVVTGTTSSVPVQPPPKKTFMEENGTYIIIGGVALIGIIIMMKTR